MKTILMIILMHSGGHFIDTTEFDTVALCKGAKKNIVSSYFLF